MTTVAEALATAFETRGVQRIFGVPGGGSSLDIIDAAAARGIDFVLTRTESAAVMMAAATAEVTGTLGVALTTKGPGVANAANGIAYASLDHAPVMIIGDGFTPGEQDFVTHQVFDQQALLAPLTKGHSRLDSDAVADEIRDLIARALTPPHGPVWVELTGARARAEIEVPSDAFIPRASQAAIDDAALEHAVALLEDAERPVLIIGLEARAAAPAVRQLASKLACPVLTTYKAKGVVSDRHAQTVGLFTSGSAEAETVEQADLILLVGLDPVELLRQPWRYEAPVIDVAACRHPVHYLAPTVGVYGELTSALLQLAEHCDGSGWQIAEIADLRSAMVARLAYPACDGISPQIVVELAAEATHDLAPRPRIAVDAGAHMFSTMAFWDCEEPNDVLISNGLATMAFAVPAGIASALGEPQRWAFVFTGDGGLFMCLGELSVAVEQQARTLFIVFNDASLSLIDIKQQQRGLPARGVRWDRPDFAATMQGLGGRGYRVDSAESYKRALAEAMAGDGPALIDVVVDPSGYSEQMKALRG